MTTPITMQNIIKELNGIWFLLVFAGATIYGYAILNNKVDSLEQSRIEQTRKIESQELLLRKIEVDVAYVRALLEKNN